MLKNNNNIKEVSLCVPELDDGIIQEKLSMKVKLQVNRRTLAKEGLPEEGCVCEGFRLYIL